MSKSKEPDPKSFKGKITEKYNGKSSKASIDPEALKIVQENKELNKKVANLENDKKLRARAEKALVLANRMLDRKIIKAEDLENTVEKMTVMDDISYQMMNDFVDKNVENVASKVIEKEAGKGKIKAGLKNMILIPEKVTGMRDQIQSMLMDRPEYANMEKAMKNFKGNK